jgi:hypothetical protein
VAQGGPQQTASHFPRLMRTRATAVAPESANALNSVPLEFYKESGIINAYRDFIAHTGSPTDQPTPQAWGDKRVELLMDLLQKISVRVGYKFSVLELKAEFYAPNAHKLLEEEQTQIRQGLAKVLTGQAAFPNGREVLPCRC